MGRATVLAICCLAMLVVLAPSSAEACGEPGKPCSCQRPKKGEAKDPAACGCGGDASKCKHGETAPSQDGKQNAPPAGQKSGALRLPEEGLHAAKCGCGGPSECTCPRGKCRCKSCGRHHKARVQGAFRMVEPLKGRSGRQDPPARPVSATAGIFI